MPEKKNNGLRFIFVGFIVAIFVAVLMCGVTIRQEIIRLSSPRKQVVNTAGGTPMRRYPPPPVAQSFPQAASQAPAARAQAIPQPPAPPETPSVVDLVPDGTYERMKHYLGMWRGGGAIGTGISILVFELREKPESPGQFSGYSTFTEMSLKAPVASQNAMKAILGRRLPHSAIFVGTAANGQISFVIDQVIGSDDCGLQNMKVRPFGDASLAAEWQSKSCPGGQMVLAKVGQ